MKNSFENLCELVGTTTHEANQNQLTKVELLAILKIRSLAQKNMQDYMQALK